MSDTPKSPMKAIKAFCIECFGGGRGRRDDMRLIGNEIKTCTDKKCPLYTYRPKSGFTTMKLSEERKQKLRDQLARTRKVT